VFTQLLASQPVRQKSSGGLLASIVLHLGLATGVVYATTKTVQVIQNDPQVDVLYRAPEPDPPIEVQVPRTRPTSTSAEPSTGTIEVPRDIVRLADLPPLTATTATATDESAIAGLLRRGAPVVAAPGTPGEGEVFLADQVEVPASVAKGSPTPRYPAALASTGIIGDVRFRFVVDSAGRVEMSTVEEVMASHSAFAAAVRATLPRMRFTPATFGGKPVRQLVELPFIFRASR
jgi:TonB family protein